MEQFPDLYGIAVNESITVAEAKDAQEWNIVFRRNLQDWVLQSVKDF